MTQPPHLQHGHPDLTTVDPAWTAWNKAWTRQIKVLTDRDSLRVVVAPGAGGGAPACFYPDHLRIEVDAAYLGGNPDITDPSKARHKKTVATGYGLLVHEAAHAAHSLWITPEDTPPVVADVAGQLEEARAEYRQRGRRRGDRQWIRHTVTTLLLSQTARADDLWHAGRLAALLLARVDARILTSKDVRMIRAAVTAVAGRKRLHRLRELWLQALECDDHDATTMIQIAWRWCYALDIDPAHRPDVPQPDLGEFAGLLAAALLEYLAAALGITPTDLRHTQVTTRHGAPATWTRRDPTEAEVEAARRLATRLRQARTQHRETAVVPAPVPPGRLRTRQAITADAQTAAGMMPTAQRWQRRTTVPPPKPTLHLAVLVDVSWSMREFQKPLSTAGWILAHGARHNEAVTTTIAFGNTATLLVAPRQRPAQVLDMQVSGGTTAFCEAVNLADQLLDLRKRHTVRMVAVVSDGDLPDRAAAQKLITTLHQAGCAVLWLRPAGITGHTFADTTTIHVADPVQAVDEICTAAVTALACA
ncbi:hypothetical protein EV385_3072 [Krasilnikovia cinnamomea]|uniref:VWA domain containing CoxE-like protein n=1 Tax=Krasilnikovia cinnamomea TaxID=349313 RepID=A0A4Q7ZK21_9ACTN|nr:VWA domain-containing protein [Krasilnikovia cinnamomea]RZU51262.1 hypothetical protein EV385_3072 [Krasilnikovia cinnamomea]